MRTLYKVLGALALVFIGICIGVGYVWYSIAFQSHTVVVPKDADIAKTIEATTTDSNVASTSTASPSVFKAPTHIATSTLTTGQKALLKTLGVDTTNLVITPAMQLCAIQALGEVRVNEIEKGATPTVSEGLTLLVCYKK